MRARRWFLSWMVGGAMVGAVVGTAGAQEPAPIGSYRLTGHASAIQVMVGTSVDGNIPEAAATFETGEIGFARAAIAWPGDLLGNAGDLLIILSGGQIPPEMESTVRLLNDPVRAEARSPGGPADASYDDAPGTSMRSTAGEGGTSARASVQGAGTPDVGTFRHATASAVTTLDAAVATATSTGSVNDVALAGGLIEIGSVVSTATASSDGVTGTGEGTTTVSGVTVLGVPATIDEDGLHVGDGDPSPVNDAINQLAEDALVQAGVEVVVSRPTLVLNGPAATAAAGSVLIAFGDGEGRVAVLLGGASATASAGPGFDAPTLPSPPMTSAPAAAFPPSARPPSAPQRSAPPAEQVVPPPAPAVDLESELTGFLGHANPLWLAAVGAVFGAVFAGALRRLGTAIADPPVPCVVGGPP